MRFLFALLIALAVGAQVRAANLQVAVAANFAEPAKAIADRFERRTGHHVLLSIGASGAFLTQIEQGAPFAVLLSADAERPIRLEGEGLGVAGTRFTYAIGRLALYSADPALVDDGGRVLRAGRFERLAIADAAAAPYGRAAMETLAAMGLTARLIPRLVKGASIAQAYQFVATGAAELGFVALSQVVASHGGSRWLVPERLHRPIDQQAILLRPGAGDPAARAFLAFLKSSEARRIIAAFGYSAQPARRN